MVKPLIPVFSYLFVDFLPQIDIFGFLWVDIHDWFIFYFSGSVGIAQRVQRFIHVGFDRAHASNHDRM